MLKERKSGSSRVVLQVLVAVSLASATWGCAAAAVGAGAAGGIAYTDRGAKGEVKGDVGQVSQQAKRALQSMGIQLTGTEMKESGREQNLSGKSGGTDISVDLTQAGANTTHVEVIARESALRWNKDFAKEILAKILQQG